MGQQRLGAIQNTPMTVWNDFFKPTAIALWLAVVKRSEFLFVLIGPPPDCNHAFTGNVRAEFGPRPMKVPANPTDVIA